MKQRISLFIFFGLVSLILCSYSTGPAFNDTKDGTGAEGNNQTVGNGCSGAGCHSITSANSVIVELDSAGVAVTTYHPGASYTVKISGTNATGATLPKFGFQLATVLSSGAGTLSATQAGTWDSTSLPANVRYTTPAQSLLNIPIIEHSSQIAATSGTGTNGTVYSVSIPWTAPAAGTGSIAIYGVLNAVNNNGSQSGDFYQKATPVTITEFVSCPAVTLSATGTSLTAQPAGATSYTWYLNGAAISGATSATYTPVSSGSYTVQVSSTGGCTGTSGAVSFITTGIISPSLADQIEVYPTIVYANVNIKNTTAANLTYNVYGMDGRLCDRGSITGTTNTSIDMSSFSPGLYIIKLADQERTATYKVVKQ